MIIDAREVDDGKRIDADVCIIGAGAAGITIALELAHSRIDICLLESGGLEVDSRTQSLQNGAYIGRRYRLSKFGRARYFGGATNFWGGHCVPLRAINFEQVPWIPYSGWPFGLVEVQPYYSRAHKFLNLGDFDYNSINASNQLGLPLFPFATNKIETVLSRYMGPTKFDARRFGSYYLDDIRQSSKISVYLFANVTSINQYPAGHYITDVSVQTLTGRRFSVCARYYVLATGGIENPRLLLLSTNVQSKGLGNEMDLVGRFFMDHVWYRKGCIISKAQREPFMIYGATHLCHDAWVKCHLALPEAVVRQQQIPDFRAEVVIGTSPLVDRLCSFAYEAVDRMKDFYLIDRLPFSASAVNRYRGLLWRLDQMHPPLKGRLKGRIVYHLRNLVEQVPNPDSRVRLADRKDALGLSQATVEWRLSRLDKEGIKVAHGLIAAEVERSGFGRMRVDLLEDVDEMLYGAKGVAHHMGTTRMHPNPRWGVVDADCRIHGLNNIFIAGSSVFPTCGYANPTLTIIALAIRLADHLRRALR